MPDPTIVPVVFSADAYVKPFLDNNWLSIAIFLYLLRGIATNFHVKFFGKVYQVLASTYQFVRPGSIKTEGERTEKPGTPAEGGQKK